MRARARTASWSMIIPERIRIFELLHDVTIFSEVRGQVLLHPMLWTRLVQQIRQTVRIRIWPSTALGRFTLTPLALVMCISISHKVKTVVRLTLAAVSMTRRVVVLPLGVAALFSLPCLIIVRLGILGTIRVGILHQCSHKGAHIIAVVLEPSQLHLQ